MHAPRPKWVVAAPADHDRVAPLVDALSIPEPLAMLLVQRGFDSVPEARSYLRPSLETLSDPFGPLVRTSARS